MKVDENVKETKTWPDFAIGLYDLLTGRGAEISYELANMEVLVPSRSGDNPEYYHWRFNGTLKIRTRDQKSQGDAS
ncbi:MAG: hypothetical protein RDV48_24985 [Candidatus Eremiobacteraeota bacterium]|nr:hypothetical protein [Candidatus Eremiobacteraeota bacterium]